MSIEWKKRLYEKKLVNAGDKYGCCEKELFEFIDDEIERVKRLNWYDKGKTNRMCLTILGWVNTITEMMEVMYDESNSNSGDELDDLDSPFIPILEFSAKMKLSLA